jgi:hypothetical protein
MMAVVDAYDVLARFHGCGKYVGKATRPQSSAYKRQLNTAEVIKEEDTMSKLHIAVEEESDRLFTVQENER